LFGYWLPNGTSKYYRLRKYTGCCQMLLYLGIGVISNLYKYIFKNNNSGKYLHWYWMSQCVFCCRKHVSDQHLETTLFTNKYSNFILISSFGRKAMEWVCELGTGLIAYTSEWIRKQIAFNFKYPLIQIYARLYVGVHKGICLCTFMCAYMCVYLCVCVHGGICMYVYICAYMCVYICKCMHVCIYVRMYTCIYACMYICMCIEVRIFFESLKPFVQLLRKLVFLRGRNILVSCYWK
jgi:hypothetical protein